MIEIILLYFLTKSIGELAVRKGLPRGRWKLITVMAWILFEITGLIIGMAFFGTGNLYGLLAFGIVCAFGGYLTVKYTLEKKPDENTNQDINRIGTDQLRP